MRRLAAVALLLAFPAARSAAEDPKPPPTSVPSFWTADELRRIDLALDLANCDRKDLGFQKRPIDDPFRLQVVNRALDDPLSLGDDATSWIRAARAAPGDLLSKANDALGLVQGAFVPDALPM